MADVLTKVNALLGSLGGDGRPMLTPARARAWLTVLIAGVLVSVVAAAEITPKTGNPVGYYSGALDLVAIAVIYAFALRRSPRFWGWWFIFAAFALDGLWNLFYPFLQPGPDMTTVNAWVGQNGPMLLLVIGLLAFRPPWQRERRSAAHAAVALVAVLLAYIVAVKTMPEGYVLNTLGYIQTFASALVVGAGVWVMLERGLAPLIRIGLGVGVGLLFLNETLVTHTINYAAFNIWEVFPWQVTSFILAAIAAFAAGRWSAARWPAPAPRAKPPSPTAVPPSAAVR